MGPQKTGLDRVKKILHVLQTKPQRRPRYLCRYHLATEDLCLS